MRSHQPEPGAPGTHPLPADQEDQRQPGTSRSTLGRAAGAGNPLSPRIPARSTALPTQAACPCNSRGQVPRFHSFAVPPRVRSEKYRLIFFLLTKQAAPARVSTGESERRGGDPLPLVAKRRNAAPWALLSDYGLFIVGFSQIGNRQDSSLAEHLRCSRCRNRPGYGCSLWVRQPLSQPATVLT